jgi:hypothetical protein
LTRKELSAGVSSLAPRLNETGDHPIIVFRYKKAWSLAQPQLDKMGYGRMIYMPSPYTKADYADELMRELQSELRPHLFGWNPLEPGHLLPS